MGPGTSGPAVPAYPPGQSGQDSFSLTILTASVMLGVEADYETVLALSTNGFAPDVRPDEECRADWMTRGRGQCLDVVAARLGIRVRWVGAWAPRKYGVQADPAAGRKAAFEIRHAFKRSEVVITDSGWTESFALWGIVTAATEDGRISGANPASRENALDHVCSLWGLSRAEWTMTAAEADRIMFGRAAGRIRGDREPFLPGSLACSLPAVGSPAVPGAVVWGLRAMDAWIAQMGEPAFQEDDPGSSAGNAKACALGFADGAAVTASYLRRRLPSYPAAAHPMVASLAARYERIAALLAPFAAGDEGGGYRAIMGDPAKQRDHIEVVLRPIRAELAAAADEADAAQDAVGGL
ncbi:MAG: hypothetical protein AAB152_04570 [Candidatus Coatesbacteria bacterium]